MIESDPEEISTDSNTYLWKPLNGLEHPDQRGIGYVYYYSMLKFRHNIAQIDGETNKTETYGEILKRCVRTAIHMKEKGIKPGDMITLCSENHFNSMVPFVASFFLGCMVSSLDPTMSINDCVHLLKQVKPKMIFTSTKAEGLIEAVVSETNMECEIVVYGDTDKNVPFCTYLEANLEEEGNFRPFETKSNKETGVVFFSSGTTGMPKGICTTHFGVLQQAYVLQSSGYDSSRSLSYASLYWISSVMLLTLCVVTGSARILCTAFSGSGNWRIIDKHKVTFTFLAPSQAILMYKAGRPERINTTSLLDMIIGGGPLGEEYMLRIRDLLPGTNVSLVYGQTEVTGLISSFRPNSPKHMMLLLEKPGSCGLVYPGISYKIVDVDNEEAVGANIRGELRVKTAMQMNGYYNMNSSDTWDEDGWLRTGDVAYYDDDHCLFVVDRIKEMLKFQSWHVPPALIEAVLHSHPGVRMSAVIGVPHPEDGDHPMALVIPTSKNYTPEDILKYVHARVDDRQKLRAGLKFVDKLPLTPSGKVRRKELKDLVLSGQI